MVSRGNENRMRASTTSVVLLLCLMIPGRASSQDTTEKRLAELLASEKSWPGAVAMIQRSERTLIPLLLLWTKQPPPGFDLEALTPGLIEVFGILKVRAAIPFLIDNMFYQRIRIGPIWNRPPAAIIARVASIRALISIGPDAIPAIEEAYYGSLPGETRLGIVFAVSRMNDPRGKALLLNARATAQETIRFAGDGLRYPDQE